MNNATGVINQAPLTISAATATKTYDGTNATAVAPTVSGLFGSDTVTNLVESYSDANAGTSKTLNVNSGYIVHDANGGNNYTIAHVNSAAGAITPGSADDHRDD